MFIKSTSLLRIAIPVAAIISLSACIHTPQTELESYSHYGTLKINKAITIAPDTARTYFQNGQTANGFNQYAQHCRIEVTKLSEMKQQILPEEFKITKISLDEEYIASKDKPSSLYWAQAQATQYDFANSIQLAYTGDSQRPETMDLVHFYLHSSKQPNIYRLTCAGALSNGRPQDYPHSVRPDADIINQILGSYGQLVLKKQNN